MNRRNRWKYTGAVAGAGLAVVLFSSGVYANTSPKKEAEIQVISFDDLENNNEETAKTETLSTEEKVESLSSEESFTENTDTTSESNTELESTQESSENSDLSAEEVIENTEETEEETNTDLGLSAGAGEVLDNAEKQARNVETPQEPQSYWGYTNLGIAHVENHLNIRQEPNESGKLIGKLPKDAACEILEVDENGWAHIKSGKLDGYCSTEFLYTGEEAIARGREVASMIAIVNTQTLKVREEPSTDSIVITLIPQEEELEVVEIMDNGWVKFLLDDEEAYVSGDYVDVEERLEKAVTLTELMYGQGISNVRVDLVQYAKQFVGNPYVWGGTSLTKGADCSGFTLSIYKKYGVSLPHHAASQAQMGTKVDYSSAQPGDLVFYAKNGRINHVAIYIGNGQVIHASSPKTGIKISSWNYRTPAGIRRYLPN
ncbi:gamma-D-glutamyl-L-lysine dipeptidyl-peptidase [Lachnospiraceae bacterium]|nr:gamma-D-glutamyl-L-lysine dipeptidyl-peptidase [Lachnospiraceae bacterium]